MDSVRETTKNDRTCLWTSKRVTGYNNLKNYKKEKTDTGTYSFLWKS